MKGIVRISSYNLKHVHTYWDRFVERWITSQMKKAVCGPSITGFDIFYYISKSNNTGISDFRVYYKIVSCTELEWERMKKNFYGQYLCTNFLIGGNKRRTSFCRTNVDFFTIQELESLPLLKYTYIVDRHGHLRFELNKDDECCLPFKVFKVDVEKNVKKNLELGSLIIKAELKYNQFKGWRKKILWKMKNGNFIRD